MNLLEINFSVENRDIFNWSIICFLPFKNCYEFFSSQQFSEILGTLCWFIFYFHFIIIDLMHPRNFKSYYWRVNIFPFATREYNYLEIAIDNKKKGKNVKRYRHNKCNSVSVPLKLCLISNVKIILAKTFWKMKFCNKFCTNYIGRFFFSVFKSSWLPNLFASWPDFWDSVGVSLKLTKKCIHIVGIFSEFK